MGAFTTPVGYRMAYDTDGSSGFYYVSGGSAPSQYTPGQMIIMNNESNDNARSIFEATFVHGIIFPELRDINGYYFNIYMQHSNRNFYNFQTSPDTTNGVDGTWTTRISNPSYDDDAGDNGFWRKRAVAITPLTGIKAVRVYIYNQDNQGIRTWHLYGQPSTGQNTDRLIFWKHSLDADAILNPADLDPGDGGDVTRGMTYDKQFRIKNNSGALTATDVVVSCELLNDISPSVQAMYTFSYQGSPYAPTITIPALAPGAVSEDISVRLEVDPSATNIATSPRFRATPTSFV